MICRADWCIRSQKLDAQIFENEKVIQAAKESAASVLVIDATEELPEDIQAFMDKHEVKELSAIMLFPPGKDVERIKADKLSPQAFIKLLSEHTRRESNK